MEKNDLRSLILSIIINVIIILLLPGIKLPMEDEGKISVGLIEFREEDRKVTPKEEKREEVKPEEKPEPPTAIEPEKPVEEAPKEVQQEVTEQAPKKIPVPDAIPVPEINVETLVSTQPQERSRPIVQDEKREERVFEKEETQSERQEIKGADLQREEIAKVDTAPIMSDGEPQKIVAEAAPVEGGESDLSIPLAEETDKLEGLPQGVKDIGSPDGNITGRWDPGNVLPRYPESAELKGQTGTVRLRVYVEEDGSVNKVEMIGSGVPELNRSIEEVARTWKIYLTKNGQRIYGNVTLEIPFRLLRGE